MEIGLILAATTLIALLSVVGMLFFGREGHLTGTHRFIVPFAVGALLAVTFFELIPETLHANELYGSVAIVGGFLLFYLISNLLHTYHHHHDCDDRHDYCSTTKVSAVLLLIGDFVHNFTDGVVIASSFFVNPAAGLATTLGVALHEVPQEIAEYGVLRSAGYSALRAALLNLISATGVILGAVITIVFAYSFAEYMWLIMGVAAGNLLYVGASDLLPGVHRESHTDGTFMGAFVSTLLGVVVVGTMVAYAHINFGHGHNDEEDHAHQEEIHQLYGHTEVEHDDHDEHDLHVEDEHSEEEHDEHAEDEHGDEDVH